MNRYCLIIFFIFISACSSNSTKTVKTHTANSNIITINNKLLGSTYMRTGFYFLAEKGIIMRLDKSNKFYTISPSPFASVQDISTVKIKKTRLTTGEYTDLCMIFDEIGTEDLREGTGNPLHPEIAVVVANRLLYVVKNTISFKTGVMFVGLEGYSEKEIEEMRHAIDMKR